MEKKKRNRVKGKKYQSDFAMSLDEIAKIEGSCKQSVSRDINNALKKLRKPHNLLKLRNYY
jgi:predicted DNA-binding protein YlxM (UPF0122 family)